MIKERILITDIDNTLFSWVDFFGSCFRALVHAVSSAGNFEEEELYKSFQILFQNEGTVEYRKAIQENLLVQKLTPDKQEELINVGSVAFGRTMRKHLCLYPGVLTTLKQLHLDGVKIVAVTNSGALQALERLRRLGISKYLDGLIAWKQDVTGLSQNDGNFKEILAKRIHRSGLPWVITLSKEELKPNPVAYQKALNKLGVKQPNIWVIGDSLHKDLSPAIKINAKSIWAKYGIVFDKLNFDTLLKITHWSEEKVKETYSSKILEPNYKVNEFSKLLKIIPLLQIRKGQAQGCVLNIHYSKIRE